MKETTDFLLYGDYFLNFLLKLSSINKKLLPEIRATVKMYYIFESNLFKIFITNRTLS